MDNQESEFLTIGPNSIKKRQIREITVKKITMVEEVLKGGPLMIPLRLVLRKLKPADGDPFEVNILTNHNEKYNFRVKEETAERIKREMKI
ncbi:hypothetical protein [Paraburkholderia sp. CI3]|uniref:hypothetical protein n=1 Tax=Paraburkholderia sp. CI3 TaxID=2991060 RepID=UPI003D19DB5C